MSLDPSVGGASYIPKQMQSNAAKELKAQKTSSQEMQAKQVDIKEDIHDSQEDAFNPFAANKRMKEKMQNLKSRIPKAKTEAKQTKQVSNKEAALKQGNQAAKEFTKAFPEVKEDALKNLLKEILEQDPSPEEILKMAHDVNDDPSLVDQVLEFLKENSPHELEKKIKKAQEDFRSRKMREIAAGKNVQEQAMAFSAQGLGSPSFLRDLYRKITGDPMEDHELFDELSEAFSYEQLIKAVRYLLHSLGADVKSKGPSISRGELHTLMTEIKKLQLVLGVYRFFESRMNLLYDFFDRYELEYPEELTFQIIARSFVTLSKDHYPNSQKVMTLDSEFFLEDEMLGFMMILTQMRDAVRNVSSRLFYTIKHKQDILNSYMEAIEQLDELIDEEEDDDEYEDDE